MFDGELVLVFAVTIACKGFQIVPEVSYLEDVDELSVGDVAVLVLVEVVEDDAQLLSSEEDAQLRHELLELQLLQDTVLVAVKAL